MNLLKISKSLQILLVICCFMPCIYSGCNEKKEEPLNPSDTPSSIENEVQETTAKIESTSHLSLGEQIIHYLQFPDGKNYSMIGYVLNKDAYGFISAYLILLLCAIYFRFFQKKHKLNLWFSFIMFVTIAFSYWMILLEALLAFMILVVMQLILMLVDWRIYRLSKKKAYN